jgi:hypothetical protein
MGVKKMRSSERYFIDGIPAEQKLRYIKEELLSLRRTIINLIPEPYRSIITPPYSFSVKTQEESRRWVDQTVKKVLELVKPKEVEYYVNGSSSPRAICPLCGESPMASIFYPENCGFAYPLGLERHLGGTYGLSRCSVMQAVRDLQRVYHCENWPDDYGPYSADIKSEVIF